MCSLFFNLAVFPRPMSWDHISRSVSSLELCQSSASLRGGKIHHVTRITLVYDMVVNINKILYYNFVMIWLLWRSYYDEGSREIFDVC